jgi:hypothetical protein
MQQHKYKNQYSFVQTRLLSIQSGLYLNIEDIIFIAKKLKFTLPYKSRELSLQKLLFLVKEHKVNDEFISLFLQILELKKKEYLYLYAPYKNAKTLLDTLLKQLSTTRMLIIKEFS